MAIEIVDLPSYKMVIFHGYVNFYQRVSLLVGGWALPLWRMMEWKSVGMMTFPTYGKS